MAIVIISSTIFVRSYFGYQATYLLEKAKQEQQLELIKLQIDNENNQVIDRSEHQSLDG